MKVDNKKQALLLLLFWAQRLQRSLSARDGRHPADTFFMAEQIFDLGNVFLLLQLIRLKEVY